MDRDRFKNNRPIKPVKRSINGEEHPLHQPMMPVVITPTSATAPLSEPSLPEPTTALKYKTVTFKKEIIKKEAPVPELFDGEDDEDLFGVWATQKKLKKARQDQENKQKAAKMAAKMLKKEQKKAAKKAVKPHDFAVSVSVPRISKYKKKHPKIFYPIAASLLIVAVAGISYVAYNKLQDTPKRGSTAVLGTVSVKPDFATVYAAGPAATELRYDETKKVASYNDTLTGVPITISQQPLPSGFKTDPSGEVAKLATQINANEKISTVDTVAYSGLSIKGPQTVVFVKNDLLIFIIAQKKIETLDWIKYIESIK